MKIIYRPDHKDSGAMAAEAGAEKLREALRRKDEANIILATGLSQFAMLSALREYDDIAWERVNAFHLDEYIGLPVRHPASFRKVLWQEFASRLPVPLKSFAWIDGEADPETERKRLSDAIARHPIDVGFIGIGENGHLAFNDPPADFTTTEPYLIVTLDDGCRKQQMGEGWFKTMEDVPARAISISIPQILKSASLIVTCPDRRKAEAVKNTVTQAIDSRFPASILRTHADCALYLDEGSASLLDISLDPAGAAYEIPMESGA